MEERVPEVDVDVEEYRRQIREQMIKGYPEMAEINLQIANEDNHLESEAEETTNDFLK